MGICTLILFLLLVVYDQKFLRPDKTLIAHLGEGFYSVICQFLHKYELHDMHNCVCVCSHAHACTLMYVCFSCEKFRGSHQILGSLWP